MVKSSIPRDRGAGFKTKDVHTGPFPRPKTAWGKVGPSRRGIAPSSNTPASTILFVASPLFCPSAHNLSYYFGYLLTALIRSGTLF